MKIEQALHARGASRCELCGEAGNLAVYQVPPVATAGVDDCLLLCSNCREQIEDPGKVELNHWRCLNDSMWSQVPAVQVMAWRMLTRLRAEGWPQGLLDMLYLDEATQAWAEAVNEGAEVEDDTRHKDSNGVTLEAGDTVTLIKDLNVKGANFTAKRGTAVRNISLVADNPEHIEGRVSGQQIVILTQFVKRAN